ncbi:MAG: hypothetical protein ACI92O_000439 [Colwellia sp.]|jgi:hypothetical protein
MKTLKLSVFDIQIMLDEKYENVGRITSDFKERGKETNQDFNNACHGLEAFILAQYFTGIDITTPTYSQSIKLAYQSITKQFSEKPITNHESLNLLSQELDGEVTLSNPTDIATLHTIKVARDLVQQSREKFTIVIPDNVESIHAGEKCGEWLPALVFIPNKVIHS